MGRKSLIWLFFKGQESSPWRRNFSISRSLSYLVVNCCISFHFSIASLFSWLSIFVSITCPLKSCKMFLYKMNEIFIWEDEKRTLGCFYSLHWYNMRVLCSREELPPASTEGNRSEKRLNIEIRLHTPSSRLACHKHSKRIESKSPMSRLAFTNDWTHNFLKHQRWELCGCG